MKILPLSLHTDSFLPNEKLQAAIAQFDALIQELNTRAMPDEVCEEINEEIRQINAQKATRAATLIKMLDSKRLKIYRILEKKLKWVVKNHYRNLWMILGMSAFGLPIGYAFSIAIGNWAFLAMGLPIGMPIGMAIGAQMDKKAEQQGRQLNIE